jgi:MoxR-like ATPase
VIKYALRLVRSTRQPEPGADAPAAGRQGLRRLGRGPRASQALVLGAKARAVLDGRFAAEVEDVKALAQPALRHRIVTSFRAEAEGVRPPQVIDALVAALAT